MRKVTLHRRPALLLAVAALPGLAISVSAQAGPVDATLKGALVYTGAGRTAPPANDDFASAKILEGTSGSLGGSTREATKQSGEPAHAGNVGGASVWYRWVAPQDGWFVLYFDSIAVSGTVARPQAKPLLAVYTGDSIDSLTEITRDVGYVTFRDLGATGYRARIAFIAAAGTSYWIALDGYDGATYMFDASWGSFADVRPAHDDFADALAIEGPSGKVTGTNLGATPEPGEPKHYRYGVASVWLRWTAPATRYVRFNTTSASIAVYTGTAVDALTLVGRSSWIHGDVRAVSFRAQIGTTYSIAVVNDAPGERDPFELSWYPGAIITGTSKGEVLRGTPGRDYIDARGGNDIVYGLGGADVIEGGSGSDRLHGGYGNDRLDSRDFRRGNDAIYGGRGHDTARADRGDLIRGVP